MKKWVNFGTSLKRTLASIQWYSFKSNGFIITAVILNDHCSIWMIKEDVEKIIIRNNKHYMVIIKKDGASRRAQMTPASGKCIFLSNQKASQQQMGGEKIFIMVEIKFMLIMILNLITDSNGRRGRRERELGRWLPAGSSGGSSRNCTQTSNNRRTQEIWNPQWKKSKRIRIKDGPMRMNGWMDSSAIQLFRSLR